MRLEAMLLQFLGILVVLESSIERFTSFLASLFWIKLYRIRYDDDDLEHFTLDQLLKSKDTWLPEWLHELQILNG